MNGWINGGKPEYDYGAILLETELGRRTGCLGFAAYNDTQLKATTANLSGYPGDKGGGTQWFHGSNVTSVDAREVSYTTTVMGRAEAPSSPSLTGYLGDQRLRGYDNFGTRINSEVSANLISWKA